jgi:hypothetical protein
VISGGGAEKRPREKVNVALVAPERPPSRVTTTTGAVARLIASGVVQVTVVPSGEETGERQSCSALPSSTAVTSARCWPVMVTTSPPAQEPLRGTMELTMGETSVRLTRPFQAPPETVSISRKRCAVSVATPARVHVTVVAFLHENEAQGVSLKMSVGTAPRLVP